MKRMKKSIMGMVLAAVMIFTAVPAMPVSAADENGFVVDASGVLSGYEGMGGSITIPAGVTEIASSVFQGNASITSVTIPDGVVIIGSSAFANCANLGSLSVGGSVSSVGASAFAGCGALSSVSYGARSVPDSAFSGCSSLTSFTVADGTPTIGANAFANCSNLSSISVPSSTSTINLSAFSGCANLSSISIGGGNSSYASSDGALYNASMTKLLYCPPGKSSISIAGSTTSIGSGAFSGCSHISTITIPSSVSTIEAGAFSNCTLSTITIPAAVTTIGSQSGWSIALIRGTSNSAAHTFADGSGIPFEATDGGATSTTPQGDVDADDSETESEEEETQSSGGSTGGSSSGGGTIQPASGGTAVTPTPSAGAAQTPTTSGSGSSSGSSASSVVVPTAPVGIDESIPTQTIEIKEDQEAFTIEEMQEIIATNESYNISFENENGVCIKFARGAMKLVDGIEQYDFRVRLIMKYNRRTVDAADMTENNFTFELAFRYEGDLPATAYVYVPIGTKYAGQTIYYYTCDNGELTNISYGVVDDDGNLIVSQTHCSSYVGLNEGIHVLDGTPTTGDGFDYRYFLFIAIFLAGAYFLLVKRNGRKIA